MLKPRTLLALMLFVPLAWSQSAVDLAQKYRHHEVFEIEPGVQLSARFAANGLVCEMDVEQTHFKKDAVDLSTGLERGDIRALIDRLVPTSERGDKEEEFSGPIKVIGTTMTTTGRYENVIVRIISRIQTPKKTISITGPTVAIITWRKRPCS